LLWKGGERTWSGRHELKCSSVSWLKREGLDGLEVGPIQGSGKRGKSKKRTQAALVKKGV